MKAAILLVVAVAVVFASAQQNVYLSDERSPREIHVDLINNATDSIRAIVYKFSDEDILDALKDAVDRGVRVTLVCDLEENEESDSFAYEMYDRGADVRLYSTSKYPKLHAKFSLFDSHTAVYGSANWSDGSGTDNMEIVFVHKSSAMVEQLGDFFDKLYDDADDAKTLKA